MGMKIAFGVFLASLAVNIAWLARAPSWLIAPGLLAGWYLADLASGAVHMYMDYRPCKRGVGLDRLFFFEGSRGSAAYIRLRDEIIPHIGLLERVVFDFKSHHPRPLALGRRPLLRLIGRTLIAALPFTLLLNLVNLLWPVTPTWLTAGAVSFLIGGVLAQYFHGSLHRDEVPAIVTLMRRLGLLMYPAAHVAHHESLQRDFATNSGWSNGFLNIVFRVLRGRGMLRDEGLEPTG